MTLELDAFIHSQPRSIRETIKESCKHFSLEEIQKAHTAKAAQERDSLINKFLHMRVPISKITNITKVDREYALWVLKERGQYGVPVRTQRWPG